MFYFKYITHKVFTFSQGLSVNLSHYEKKFRPQSSFLTEKIVSNGGCAAFVLFFIKSFENFGKIPSPQLFSQIKKELTNSEVIMPKIYFWMSLQHLIYDDFKTPNSYAKGYSPYQDPEIIALGEQLKNGSLYRESINSLAKIKEKEHYFRNIFNKYSKDSSTNFNFEQYRHLADNKEREYQQELIKSENRMKAISTQYDNKINAIKNQLRAEVNHPRSENDLLFDLCFMRRNLTNFKLADVLSNQTNINSINNEIIKHHQVLAKSNLKNMCICLSTSIYFKESAHKICFIMTNEYENQYLIFDPNFGLFAFTRMHQFLQAIKDLTNSTFSYRTLSYDINIFYLNE